MLHIPFSHQNVSLSFTAGKYVKLWVNTFENFYRKCAISPVCHRFELLYASENLLFLSYIVHSNRPRSWSCIRARRVYIFWTRTQTRTRFIKIFGPWTGPDSLNIFGPGPECWLHYWYYNWIFFVFRSSVLVTIVLETLLRQSRW
jgi:hypothetical protein